MQTHTDEHWMQMAIDVARSKGSDPSTSPLGCVIVLDGKVIAAERNQTKELPDATAHAEMMAIRRACEQTGKLELRGATLYSTLQPCGMCTMASIWSKVGRVVYGAVAAMSIQCISKPNTSIRSASSATLIGTISRLRAAACAQLAQNFITVPTLT